MPRSDPFHRYAAFTEQGAQNMRMRDRLAGLVLRTKPANTVLVPDPLGADGERMCTTRHRQVSPEPRKFVIDRLCERTRPQGATHVIRGTEQARPEAGTRNRARRYEAKVHDVHAEQAGASLA